MQDDLRSNWDAKYPTSDGRCVYITPGNLSKYYFQFLLN